MKVNKKKTINRYVFAAVFAAIIAVSSFFRIPIGPIPIVLTNMFIVLSGTVLGSFYGAVASLIFIGAGLIGFPVFVVPGLGVFATPLGGYIIGYFFAALAAGFICGLPKINEKKLKPINVIRISLASFLAFVIILICGSLYLMRLNSITLESAVALGILPFLIGDAVKLAAAVPLALALRPIAARYIGDNI
jgi:biotin transport system substrate-specific component